MSDTWDHTLERLPITELARLARHDADFADKFGPGYRTHGMCGIGRVTHQEPATYVHTYSYVTGRAGRVSWAEKRLCDQHATKAAKQHGIDLAVVPLHGRQRKHASAQMFEQAFGR